MTLLVFITVISGHDKPQPPGCLLGIADFVTDPTIKKILKEKDKGKEGEYGGIGTPATRGTILETLKKRNYITVEKGRLIPTDTGYALIDALPDIAVNPDMTALWAEKQIAIENGDLTVEEFINELYSELSGMNRPGFPGECFICELRLPDHRFRWKHNKLFLLLPEEYGPAFPAIVDCYTSPPTLVWPVPLLHGFSSSYGVLPPLCKDH